MGLDMKKLIGIILLTCSFFLSCIGNQKADNREGNTSEDAVEIVTSLDSVSATDTIPKVIEKGIRILTQQSLSLTGDSTDLDISLNEIKAYFETSDTMSIDIALSKLQSYNKLYSIRGELLKDGDTLSYAMLGNGIGLTYKYSRSETEKQQTTIFYEGKIGLPSDTYKTIKSKLKILCFEKSRFDFSIWEEWKKNDTDGYIIDNNELYRAYKRWNEVLDANDIYRAILSMERVPARSYLNVDWSVDYHCNVYGMAIYNGQLYTLYMNGGGVIFLIPTLSKWGWLAHGDDELIWGCYKPECEKYFIQRLSTNEDGY